MRTDQEEHAVEGSGAGAGDAEGPGEPPGGTEGVGQAEHPGAYDGDDDVPQRLRGRGAPPLQQRHLHFRRHGGMVRQTNSEPIPELQLNKINQNDDRPRRDWTWCSRDDSAGFLEVDEDG